ncbi:hypothetical protein [Methanobrevibacter sp.]|uniref:hypothetical protein n=1 Tax=Methanobrevibacter sp. TaxID=66852 RepID=UPI0025FC8B81|nr:hypothetical protein [Methanobrevibacter sp.]MEE0025380.1 hypothetical protein [Methanobrevibacter sp.]
MARRNEGIMALLMILILIAFVIGSAIGIFISINEHDNQTNEKNNNTSHVENVTVEMTSKVHKDKVVFDYDADLKNYSENNTKTYID